MKILGACLLIVLIVSAGVLSQNRSIQYILPSDDELYEAYLIGDITYEQYLLLLDIVTNNIRPGEVLYLDDIPQAVLEKYTLISPEPDYVKPVQEKSQFHVKHSYSSYINEDTRSKYQTNLSYKIHNFYSAVTLRREFSGRERFLNRSITITEISSHLKKLQLGNFSKKFGLGLLVGYHGKNVSFSDEINDESFLFPDYGGYNGLYTDWNLNQYSIQTVSSLNRDEEFTFLTNSFSIGKRFQDKEVSFQTAFTNIENRYRKVSKSDFKTSLYLRTLKGKINNKTEIVTGNYADKLQYALVSENGIKHFSNKLTLESWLYSDNYIDISGAGGTSLLSEQVELADIDYSYYSKRRNQAGAELTFTREFTSGFDGKISQLYAYKSNDSTEWQSYVQLRYRYSQYAKFAYDFSYRDKERFSFKEGSYIKRIHRVSGKFSLKNTATRVYLQHESKTGEDATIGLFTEFRYKPDNFGLLQLWCNFGRYNLSTERIDYIYLFIRHNIDLTNSVKLDIKLSHRYQRESTVKSTNQMTMSFECTI